MTKSASFGLRCIHDEHDLARAGAALSAWHNNVPEAAYK
jgi:hypothetical protein